DDVDEPGFDIGQQPLQCRSLQRAAGVAAIVIALANGGIAFRALAGDVGLAGLTLRIERVELHVEAFLARLARIDGAALAARNDRDGFLMTAHRSSLRASRRPKKR